MNKRNSVTSFVTAVSLALLIAGCNGSSPGSQFSPAEISLKEQGELKELLDSNLTFKDSKGRDWVAPKGTLTDGASVPRIALPVTDGRWDRSFLKAAVIHDAYCQSDNRLRAPEQYRTKPWPEVHRMFHEAMLAGGTAPMLAKLMFAAVWLGGPRWDVEGEDIGQAPGEALTRGFSGAKSWIESNDPSIEEIEADLERRRPVLIELFQLETGIDDALRQGRIESAAELIEREQILLEREATRRPDDPMVQTFQGYLHKNSALLNRRVGDEAAAEAELRMSERSFSRVIDIQPNNPSALSGLATTAIARGDLDEAERLTNEALRIAPENRRDSEQLRRIDQLRAIESNR